MIVSTVVAIPVLTDGNACVLSLSKNEESFRSCWRICESDLLTFALVFVVGSHFISRGLMANRIRVH
jgi:uncharacterized membrane protein YsdA (DUF1294 family)